MSKLIRRMAGGAGKKAAWLARGSKGMEALQAVILVGIAFFILWGVQAIWKGQAGTFNTAVKDTLIATDKSASGSGALIK